MTEVIRARSGAKGGPLSPADSSAPRVPINLQVASAESHSRIALTSPLTQFTVNCPTMPSRGELPQSEGSVMSISVRTSELPHPGLRAYKGKPSPQQDPYWGEPRVRVADSAQTGRPLRGTAASSGWCAGKSGRQVTLTRLSKEIPCPSRSWSAATHCLKHCTPTKTWSIRSRAGCSGE